MSISGALSATGGITQLVHLARVVVQTYETVFEDRASKRNITKEIAQDVEDLDGLIEQRPDLVEAPDLACLIARFCYDLEQIHERLNAAIPKKQSRLAFKNHFKKWWRSGDIQSDLERTAKEIEGCYRRLVTGGVVQINLNVYQMQQTFDALERRVKGLVSALQVDPRRASAIIGIPSMTVQQMQSALTRTTTDLEDESIPHSEKPFLNQKAELLSKALTNNTGKVFLPIKSEHENRGQDTTSTKADANDDRLMSTVRRISLGEDEADAVSETLRAIRALRAGSTGMTPAELGDSLRRLGHALGSLGLREQGLIVTQWEVEIYRKLAEDHPSTYRSKLSMSLSYLSRCLRDLARKNEALLAIQEAVGLSRNTSKDNRIHQASLAMTLSTFSSRLAAVGRREDAWRAINESVMIYRKLAKDDPDVFLPDLAMALNSLSTRLQARGSLHPALTVIQESVKIRRELAAKDPSRYSADLALSLGNLSNRFADNQMHHEALKAIQESSDIRRDLAYQRPEVFQEDLGSSLNNLSVCLKVLGRTTEALSAMKEAEGIYRNLYRDLPSEFQGGLSMTLYNYSTQLFSNGQKKNALKFAKESVELRLGIAQDRPPMFLPKLAKSLNLLCDIIIHILGPEFEAHQKVWFPYKWERVERLLRRAVAIYQDLARRNPTLPLPDFATPLDMIDGDMITNRRLRRTVAAATGTEVPPSPTASCSSSTSSIRSSIRGGWSTRSMCSTRTMRSIRRIKSIADLRQATDFEENEGRGWQ